MNTFKGRISRIFSAAVAIAALGALVAGCSGGHSTTLPAVSHPGAAAPKEPFHPVIHQVLNISSASIPTMLAHLKSSRGVASPTKGGVISNNPGNKPIRMGPRYGDNLIQSRSPSVVMPESYWPYINTVNILVNSPSGDESPWGGRIGIFQHDLYNDPGLAACSGLYCLNYGQWSDRGMIDILNQYIGRNATNVFTASYSISDYPVNYTPESGGTFFNDDDINNIVYEIVNQYPTGWGLNTIFNVFLPRGSRNCSSLLNACYQSNNVPAAYGTYSSQPYCAYHETSSFNSTNGAAQPVYFTVEPYQGIQGCAQGSPLPSATASTLSHETFETITDPDGYSGWHDRSGLEIGDICSDPREYPRKVIILEGDLWQIQPEFDNRVNDCSYGSTPNFFVW